MANIINSLSGYVKKNANFDMSADVDKFNEAVASLNSNGKLSKFTSITKTVTVETVTGGNIITNINTKAAASIPSAVSGINPSISDGVTITNKTEEHRVKLVNTSHTDEEIIFNVRPQLNETRSANYSTVELLHHPSDILKYQKTSARTWSFSATLVSRTPEEAKQNLQYTNWIRAWVMPYYGEGTANSIKSHSSRLGAPPPILKLTAYGNQMIGPVPVVLESYDISWPADVDYIQTSYDDSAVPFPVVLTINLSMKEAFSPAEYSGFDLYRYKLGDMGGAFTPIKIGEKVDTSSANTDTSVTPRMIDNAIDAEARDEARDSGDEIRARRTPRMDGRMDSEKILMDQNYVPRNSGRGDFGADDGKTMSMSMSSLGDLPKADRALTDEEIANVGKGI